MKNANMKKEFPTNRNCKKVVDITNNIEYGSMTEAAAKANVTLNAMSIAIRNKRPCKGIMYVLAKELHENIDTVREESAKANVRAAKERERADRYEAQLKANEVEMAEFRQWKAEQEAKRKAEEKAAKEEAARLEKERKAEEKRQALIVAAQNKIASYNNKIEKHNELGKSLEQKLMQAEMELEALMDNGKEVA